MDMISLRGIQKSYGSHQVLENVDLTVRQGEIYGLIGKNGAGKTTIFKIILGLTKFESGQLRVSDCAEAKRILAENSVSVLQESSEYKSLKDYYFELVGGNIHE